MKVIQDRILVEPIKVEDSGALYMPEKSKDLPLRGKVKLVGKECEDVAVGDTILYSKHSGTNTEVDGTTYVVMREGEALLIL